ncbi:MAG: deoxyguanosinetriphosphate triphosphohydrolase [Planctomycetaceae bacterium]|nr:deoxyguanosinetriphosphate triphosphohydrolase [Planctomycetaceae bacterium]
MTHPHEPPSAPYHLLDRAAKEAHQAATLAPFALRSAASRGRRVPEEPDELRTEFERDRDRIVHATAFRRLMYKAQVFVNREGDHHRTRLSHSLEVAQVARSVASALRLEVDFAEALSLCHDIGHPPFGHRGEWALDELMRSHGGFRHNNQVLRVVDRLERRSPAYEGLNLTRELRESLLKHEKAEDWPAEFDPRPRWPYLEAQVVDLADSTAYDVHDIEDGLRAGMFEEADLIEASSLWRLARERVETRHRGFLASSGDVNLRVKRTSNELIKLCIVDLIEASFERIQAADLKSPEDARQTQGMLIGHSAAVEPAVAELAKFLFRAFYRHPHLLALADHAKAILGVLFTTYTKDPAQLPRWYRLWCDQVGVPRSVCDYLAGMTDRFAEREYERITGRPAPSAAQDV